MSEHCVSCGCVVDKDYHGHHSAADCRILKFAESFAKEAVNMAGKGVVSCRNCASRHLGKQSMKEPCMYCVSHSHWEKEVNAE